MVKDFKAGFVVESDTNVRPEATLAQLLAPMRGTGHSTAAVTEDGTAHGRLVVWSAHLRDFHPQRHDLDAPVSSRMVSISGFGIADRQYHTLRG